MKGERGSTARILLVLLALFAPRDGAWAAAEASEAGPHLLRGAEAFRDGRFAEALVEFRVAARLGAKEAPPYAAAALLQLGRPEEAVEAFGASEEERDTLLDFHHALACHQARLYLCASRLLARVADRAGPRLGGRAATLLRELATALTGEPPRESIDWYLHRCAERRGEGRPLLARAHCREALGLAERRPDHHGQAEAGALLEALSRAPPDQGVP